MNKERLETPKFEALKIIGKGGFCRVYEGKLNGIKDSVAIKASKHSDIIKKEREILLNIQSYNLSGFPKVLEYGRVQKMDCIVLPLYGNNLMDLLQMRRDKKFSLKTVSLIGIQVLNLLQKIHDIGYVHRDIKPDNILLESQETGKCKQLTLIDFGLSTTFLDFQKRHIIQQEEEAFVGNHIFASRRAMLLESQSRGDDMESFLFMMMYLLHGELPWKQKYKRSLSFEEVTEIKMKSTPDQLWPLNPKCFQKIAKIIWQTRFNERPRYELIEKYFVKQIKIINQKVDNVFDWNHSPEDKMQTSSQYEGRGTIQMAINVPLAAENTRQRASSIDIGGTVLEKPIKQESRYLIEPIKEEEDVEELSLIQLHPTPHQEEAVMIEVVTIRVGLKASPFKHPIKLQIQEQKEVSPFEQYNCEDYSYNSQLQEDLTEVNEDEESSLFGQSSRYSMSPNSNLKKLQSSKSQYEVSRPSSWDFQETI